MKNLILTTLFSVFTIGIWAQNPTTPIQIENQTSCDIYVRLMATDLGCVPNTYATVRIPVGAIWTSPFPPAGKWFDAITVSDNAAFTHGPSGCCYVERLSFTWSLCTAFPALITNDTCCENGDPAGGANCFGPLTADLTTAASTPATPYLLVHL